MPSAGRNPLLLRASEEIKNDSEVPQRWIDGSQAINELQPIALCASCVIFICLIADWVSKWKEKKKSNANIQGKRHCDQVFNPFLSEMGPAKQNGLVK